MTLPIKTTPRSQTTDPLWIPEMQGRRWHFETSQTKWMNELSERTGRLNENFLCLGLNPGTECWQARLCASVRGTICKFYLLQEKAQTPRLCTQFHDSSWVVLSSFWIVFKTSLKIARHTFSSPKISDTALIYPDIICKTEKQLRHSRLGGWLE